MTKKKEITENGVLKKDIEQLMTPQAVKELKELSPTMQQFLLRWQDKRDMILGDQLRDELKEFLAEIHEKDNAEVCKNVAEIVVSQNKRMFDAFASQTALIESIASDITLIKGDIATIDERLSNIEKRLDLDEQNIKTVESKLQLKKERIDNLEAQIKLLNPDLVKRLIEEFEEMKPLFDKMLKYSSFKTTFSRVVWAMILGWIITFATLHWVFHVI